MNGDLLLDPEPEDVCDMWGHDWLAMEVDGTEMAECARCGVLMGAL